MNVESGSREGRTARHLGHLLRFSPLILRQLAAFKSSSPILLLIQVLFLIQPISSVDHDGIFIPQTALGRISSIVYDVFLAFILQPPLLSSLPVTSTSALAEQLRITPSTWSRHGVFPAVAAGFPGSMSEQSLIYHPPFQHPYSLPYKLRPTRSLCTGTPAPPPMPGGSATGTTESRVGEQQRCAEICPPSWLPSCRSASSKKTGVSERGWMEPKEDLGA